MYATCLFCHSNLGKNESLEHFPVGRRIAYDEFTGRLWVICRGCKRWNLSPIETRWEAIEEAERLFRSTRLRVQTDNIAMAQLRDGLELVRIGKPPRLELAGWRYGNVFGKRWRKHAAIAASSLAVSAVYFGSTIGPTVFPGLSHLAGLGSSAYLLYQGAFLTSQWRERNVIRFHLRDEAGNVMGLTRRNVQEARIRGVKMNDDWALNFKCRSWNDTEYAEERIGSIDLEGEHALRALGTMMPYVNRAGARERQVLSAIKVIDNSAGMRELFTLATRPLSDPAVKLITTGRTITGLPPDLRLAMEMVLHEESERRALEGELEVLYERWREAEEIGKIADGLV